MGRIKRIIEKPRKFLADTFVRCVFIMGTVWLLIETSWTIIDIYNYYNETKILVHNLWLLFLIIVLPVIISAIYIFTLYKVKQKDKQIKENQEQFLQKDEIIRFHRNIIDDCFDDIYKNHKEILCKDIKNAVDNENWQQVIKIGKYGSRLFLMLACYDMRIKYGEYIVEASEKLEKLESMAMGYIDCIGWSYVQQKKYADAIKNIDIGLAAIEDLKTKDSIIMKCKAKRHLAGIMLRNKRLPEAKGYREEFEQYLTLLKGKDKKIMKGSLYILNGDIALEDSENEYAKKCYKQALKLFLSCDDFERAVKINYKLGRVDERMGQKPKALKNYLIGFWQSDKISRIDEKFKNCQGICDLIEKERGLFQKVLSNSQVNIELKNNNIDWVKCESYYIEELKNLEKNIQV